MKIDVETKLIALLGMPLAFSFAARMQNATYMAMGLNMLYFYCEIGQDKLADALTAVRTMNFAGCAVTKPNKIEVMQYLDDTDPLCEKTGSCNTVLKLPDGRLKGFNTDGVGAYQSFLHAGVDVSSSSFVCLGAGGAGRAVASTLAFEGAKKLYVTDILPAMAQSLVEDINSKIAPVAEYIDFHDTEAKVAVIKRSDVIMNLTGMGMIGHETEMPVSPAVLHAGQVCFDATYNPSQTRFLREASVVGCKTINGCGMNILQGARQIEIWSGRKPPIDVMTREFDLILAETEK